MEDFNEAYDENDIEDFEDYLHYYGFDSELNDDDSDYDECDVRELYF